MNKNRNVNAILSTDSIIEQHCLLAELSTDFPCTSELLACKERDPPDVYHKVDYEEWNPEDVWKLVSRILWAEKVDVIRQQHRLCSDHKPAQEFPLAGIKEKAEPNYMIYIELLLTQSFL